MWVGGLSMLVSRRGGGGIEEGNLFGFVLMFVFAVIHLRGIGRWIVVGRMILVDFDSAGSREYQATDSLAQSR